MMLSLLRWFPQFRALEAERDAAVATAARHDAAQQAREAQDDRRIQQIMRQDHEIQEASRERDELRAALQEENTQRLILQDRLDAAQESVSRLWGMVQDANNKAYEALKSQVNFATQQKFGVTPYPEASHLPPSAEADLDFDKIVNRRLIPSELIAQQRQKLEAELLGRLTKKPA